MLRELTLIVRVSNLIFIISSICELVIFITNNYVSIVYFENVPIKKQLFHFDFSKLKTSQFCAQSAYQVVNFLFSLVFCLILFFVLFCCLETFRNQLKRELFMSIKSFVFQFCQTIIAINHSFVGISLFLEQKTIDRLILFSLKQICIHALYLLLKVCLYFTSPGNIRQFSIKNDFSSLT